MFKGFSLKALVFDLFTFGCYSGYMNIKRLEDDRKRSSDLYAVRWTPPPSTLCSSCRSGL